MDMAGDSVLAVFDAATEAVRAAFEIQGVLAERNEALPEARRMRFRIGVNLGEVIERPDGTVYGDGVNIAARLESIGEPGGVTVSGTVFDQVKNRLQVGFDFIGEQEVKNIAELVGRTGWWLKVPWFRPSESPSACANVGCVAHWLAPVVCSWLVDWLVPGYGHGSTSACPPPTIELPCCHS